MSSRWQYKVVEVKAKLFSGSAVERIQTELDKHGALGWQLVSVVQPSSVEPLRMFFKKES